SVTPSGAQATGPSFGSAISADGRYVVFATSASNLPNAVMVRDRTSGVNVPVSVNDAGVLWNTPGTHPRLSMSPDGRFIAFNSSATNLVPGANNGQFHVYVHDRDADQDGI